MDILVVDSVGHIFAYQQEHVQSPLIIPEEEMHYLGERVLGYAILSGKKRSRKFLRHLADQTLAKTVLTKEGSVTLTGTHVLLRTPTKIYEVCIDRHQMHSTLVDKPKAYGTQTEVATILMGKCGWPGDMVIEFIYENYLSKYYSAHAKPVITRMAYNATADGNDLVEIHQMGTHTGLLQALDVAERVFTTNAMSSCKPPILLAYGVTSSKEKQ